MNTTARLAGKSRRRRAWYLPRLGMIAAVSCLAAAACGGQAAPGASAPPVNSMTFKSCTVDGVAARCGTLIVPEDRLTGKGRTIPVRFVVFPATSPDRAPDPLVYFAGGPGSSAINDIPMWLSGFESLNLNRDLVLSSSAAPASPTR